MDLLARIRKTMPEFSKGQKRIAKYILEHYDKAAFMTASKLGMTADVSESTVVRFAIELGYEGYPGLQKELQEIIRTKLTAVQRISVANERLGNADVLHSVLNSDIEKIRATLENINPADFEKSVNAIIGAEKIYILGVRSSSALAGFLGFYFNLIFDNVRLVHTNSVSEMFEQILRVKKGDAVIGISFPRYSRRTIQAMQFAHDRGAQTIAITDSMNSPLARTADHHLIAQSDMASFVDSLVAPLSLINALIVAIVMRKQAEVSETFTELEKIWEEYQVYERQPDE